MTFLPSPCLILSSTLTFFLSLFVKIIIITRYASGQVTGTVLDCGDSVTHVVPVFEGFSVPHAITRADYGGRDVTNYLIRLLREAGHVFHTSAEKYAIDFVPFSVVGEFERGDGNVDLFLHVFLFCVI